MRRLQFVTPCLFGLEAVLGRELKQLGYDDQSLEDGRVTFSGDANAICRCNLWLRTAERVLLKMGDFSAASFEELFENTKALNWAEWIPKDAEFPVEVDSINSKLASVPDCQAIIKKAVVESLKKTYKVEWFPETGPSYKIIAAILKDWVTISIDTTGTGLHKRGYRKLVGNAPLRETLASGMILLSYWNKDRVLWDPFCGSGTIPVEAALIGKNIAPGLNRSFVSEDWTGIDNRLWKKTREEALDMAMPDQQLRIFGTDIDDSQLKLARYHAEKAGVIKDIHFQKMDVKDISARYKYGVIICNPPYGERLGEKKEVAELYRVMGKVFARFDTWSYYILSSEMEFEKFFGKKADKKRKLYNGMLKCNYYQYFGPPPPRNDSLSIFSAAR